MQPCDWSIPTYAARANFPRVHSCPQMAPLKRSIALLFVSRFVRLFAYGSSTLILAQFFAALGFNDTMIGSFMSLTLFGDVFISVFLTLFADRLGRRRMLTLGALLMAASGSIFAVSSNYYVLLFSAIVGVISPSGNEIGPFRAIEESTLAQLTLESERSDMFAWYILVGALGSSFGGLVSGGMVTLLQKTHSELDSYRFVFWLYTALALVKFVVSISLQADCELGHEENEEASEQQPLVPAKKDSIPRISFSTFKIVGVLCLLFALDSLGSGLVPSSLIAYFYVKKFAVATSTLGSVFFVTNLLSAASNLIAARIARKIGLVNTMVLTHLPTSIMLATIPLPSSLWPSFTILIVRSLLVTMDQAPRTAFLSIIVPKNERTAVMGIVNVVKTLSQSAGPVVTGIFSQRGSFALSFFIAGGLKASYDLLMLLLFEIKTRWKSSPAPAPAMPQ